MTHCFHLTACGTQNLAKKASAVLFPISRAKDANTELAQGDSAQVITFVPLFEKSTYRLLHVCTDLSSA